MDKEIKDGGGLFPSYGDEKVKGATLRDYFAAAALQGMLAANAGANGLNGKNVDQVIAEESYKSADAMLAEREKRNG